MGVADQVVSVCDLEKNFSAGEIVDPKTLVAKRLVSRVSGKPPVVKIVGGGDLSKKLTFRDCSVSKTAKEKIEKAGGTIK